MSSAFQKVYAYIYIWILNDNPPTPLLKTLPSFKLKHVCKT